MQKEPRWPGVDLMSPIHFDFALVGLAGAGKWEAHSSQAFSGSGHRHAFSHSWSDRHTHTQTIRGGATENTYTHTCILKDAS